MGAAPTRAAPLAYTRSTIPRDGTNKGHWRIGRMAGPPGPATNTLHMEGMASDRVIVATLLSG